MLSFPPSDQLQLLLARPSPQLLALCQRDDPLVENSVRQSLLVLLQALQRCPSACRVQPKILGQVMKNAPRTPPRLLSTPDGQYLFHSSVLLLQLLPESVSLSLSVSVSVWLVLNSACTLEPSESKIVRKQNNTRASVRMNKGF